jgi:hypothetical protein
MSKVVYETIIYNKINEFTEHVYKFILYENSSFTVHMRELKCGMRITSKFVQERILDNNDQNNLINIEYMKYDPVDKCPISEICLENIKQALICFKNFKTFYNIKCIILEEKNKILNEKLEKTVKCLNNLISYTMKKDNILNA